MRIVKFLSSLIFAAVATNYCSAQCECDQIATAFRNEYRRDFRQDIRSDIKAWANSDNFKFDISKRGNAFSITVPVLIGGKPFPVNFAGSSNSEQYREVQSHLANASWAQNSSHASETIMYSLVDPSVVQQYVECIRVLKMDSQKGQRGLTGGIEPDKNNPNSVKLWLKVSPIFGRSSVKLNKPIITGVDSGAQELIENYEITGETFFKLRRIQDQPLEVWIEGKENSGLIDGYLPPLVSKQLDFVDADTISNTLRIPAGFRVDIKLGKKPFSGPHHRYNEVNFTVDQGVIDLRDSTQITTIKLVCAASAYANGDPQIRQNISMFVPMSFKGKKCLLSLITAPEMHLGPGSAPNSSNEVKFHYEPGRIIFETAPGNISGTITWNREEY